MKSDWIHKTRVYNKAPFLYDSWIRFISSFVGGTAQLMECAMSLLELNQNDKVLDVCCGTGNLTIKIAEHITTGRIEGLDFSAKMLKAAKLKAKHSRIFFVRAKAQKIAYRNDCFDKVVLCAALHEMMKEDRERVIKEIYRVIKSGGRSLFIEPNYSLECLRARLLYNIVFNKLNPENKTLSDLRKTGLLNEIKSGGFKIIKEDISNKGFMKHILAEKQ